MIFYQPSYNETYKLETTISDIICNLLKSSYNREDIIFLYFKWAT